MRRSLLLMLALVGLAGLAGSGTAAGRHTLLVLSHHDHTAYELDPESGRILHSFKAPDQPHEGAVSADGKMVFVAVPNGPIVAILDGESFKEVARIESPMFSRTPRLAPNAPPTAKPSDVRLAARRRAQQRRQQALRRPRERRCAGHRRL